MHKHKSPLVGTAFDLGLTFLCLSCWIFDSGSGCMNQNVFWFIHSQAVSFMSFHFVSYPAGTLTPTSPVLPQFAFTLMTWWVPNWWAAVLRSRPGELDWLPQRAWWSVSEWFTHTVCAGTVGFRLLYRSFFAYSCTIYLLSHIMYLPACSLTTFRHWISKHLRADMHLLLEKEPCDHLLLFF